MGMIHDAMNSHGLYTESDMKELRDRCKTLWMALLDLQVKAKVRTDSIIQCTDHLIKWPDQAEKTFEYGEIRSCARELESAAAAAEQILKDVKWH